MKLHVEWSRPISLKAIRDHVGYDLDLTAIPNRPGVYLFGRQWGTGFEALYVGKSMKVRRRIKGHLGQPESHAARTNGEDGEEGVARR